MNGDSRWRAAALGDDAREAIYALFHSCFGHEMNPDLWDWKYDNGRGVHSGVWLGDQLVAHYGGLTRRIKLWGRSSLAFQGCDVMVHPAERGRFSRMNPLSLVTRHAIETHVGVARRHTILYGFPNERHMRAAEKLGLYQTVLQLADVCWPANAAMAPLSAQRMKPSSWQCRLAAWGLWSSMAAAYRAKVLVVRDADYLHYRYVAHPAADQYRFVLVRKGILPIGLLVLKADIDTWLIMDVIGKPMHLQANLQAAAGYVATQGGTRCRTWLAVNSLVGLHDLALERAGPDIPVAAQIVSPGIQPEPLRDSWWLMPGDSDFL